MKLNGSEKRSRNRLCLYVNERGFISIYALVLLSIVLAFTLMFRQTVKTFVRTHTYHPYAYIDLHIINQIKQEIKRKQVNEPPKNIKEAKTNVAQENIKTSNYKGCLIRYEYKEESVLIQYAFDHITHIVQAVFDPQKKIIVQYAYSKEK